MTYFLNHITIIICFCVVNSLSQDVLLHKNGIEQFTKLNFNPKVITKNKVRSITTEHMNKKELRAIVKNKKTSTYYEFNNSGQLTMYYKIFIVYDTLQDTLVEFYSYNNDGKLIELRKSEYGKYGVYKYKYEGDRLTEITQAQEENVLSSKIIFIPKNHIEKYKEKFVYENIDSLSYIKYTLSEDNVRYKEDEVLYELSKLKKEQTRYLFSKQQHSIYNYYYFEEDLVKKEEIDNYTQNQKKASIYKYDSIKRINQIETYKEDMKIYITEFLYKETGLMDAIINKDTETNAIEIIKYTHTYYK